MLVLNTNKNEQVDGMSNYNLRGGAYPDASQILIHYAGQQNSYICLHPSGETYTSSIACYCTGVNNVITPVNRPVKALCMNGTPINYIEHPIKPSNSLYGANASASVGCYNRICLNSYPTAFGFASDRTGCTNVGEIHKTIRFGTVGTLDEGATVGKFFRFQAYHWQYPGVYVRTNVATFNSLEYGIKMKWGLMHRDGSIEYAGETCRCYCGKPTGSGEYRICGVPAVDDVYNIIFHGESDGIVSQEGDRPIVDFDQYMCWDGNYVSTGWAAAMTGYSDPSYYQYGYFDMGRRGQGSNDNDEYSRPFQISLDV